MSLIEVLHEIVSDEDLFIPSLFAFVGLTWITVGTAGGAIKAVAKERTRREIAAYIAEGSMTPEQGEKLLNAGRKA